MRGRWSIGVVAIVVAIAVATAGLPSDEARTSAPLQVTLALEPDGVALSVAHGAFVITFAI